MPQEPRPSEGPNPQEEEQYPVLRANSAKEGERYPVFIEKLPGAAKSPHRVETVTDSEGKERTRIFQTEEEYRGYLQERGVAKTPESLGSNSNAKIEPPVPQRYLRQKNAERAGMRPVSEMEAEQTRMVLAGGDPAILNQQAVWESNGVIQHRGKIERLMSDPATKKQWVYFEGSESTVPLEEIKFVEQKIPDEAKVKTSKEAEKVHSLSAGDVVQWNPGGGVVPQKGEVESVYSDPDTNKVYVVFKVSRQKYPIEEVEKTAPSEKETLELTNQLRPGETENERWVQEHLVKPREKYTEKYLAFRRNRTGLRKLAEAVGTKDKYTRFSKEVENAAAAFDKARTEAAAVLSGKATEQLRRRWNAGSKRKLVKAGAEGVQKRYERLLFTKLSLADKLVVTEAEQLLERERLQQSPEKERVYKKIVRAYLKTNRWVRIGASTAIVSGVAASLGAFATAGVAGAAGFAGYRYARAALGMVVGTALGMRVRKEMEEDAVGRGKLDAATLQREYRPLDESVWKKYRSALGRMERGKRKAVVGQVLTAAVVGGGVAAFSDPIVRPVGELFKGEAPGTTVKIPEAEDTPLTQEEFERRTRVSRMEPTERPAAPPFRVDVPPPQPPVEVPPVPPPPIPEAATPERPTIPPPQTTEPSSPRPPTEAKPLPPEPHSKEPGAPKTPEPADRFVEIKPKESYPIEIRRGDSPWASMRRFVDEHLWTKSLSPEQRVYTTDYLTKRVLAASPEQLVKWGIDPESIKGFRTGASIGVSIDYSGLLRDPALDQELLRKTLELNPEQLKNLEQYTGQRSEFLIEKVTEASPGEARVELASHKEESAVAPERGTSAYEIEIRRGDSPWATMQRFVDQHEEFKKLTPSQKMQATSFLTNKILVASPEQLNRWGIDPEKLKGFRSGIYNGESIIGKSIDYSSLMQDSALKQELFGKAVGPAMRGPSVEVPPETPRPKVPAPTEPPTGRKIPSLTDQPGRGVRVPDTAARPRTDIGIGAKSVTPGTPAEMSPQVEGKMIEILRRDVYRMFGSRGILGLGASDGFEIVRQYARTQVLEVFTAEGAQGKLATFRQYLLDLSKETGVKARPGEAVEPFMRRALAVKAQMELERPAPPPPSSPKPPTYEPIPR